MTNFIKVTRLFLSDKKKKVVKEEKYLLNLSYLESLTICDDEDKKENATNLLCQYANTYMVIRGYRHYIKDTYDEVLRKIELATKEY